MKDFTKANVNANEPFFVFSDTMGNQGAFITLTGKDMKPKFTSYEAVVRIYKFSNNPTSQKPTKKTLNYFLILFLATSQRKANGVRQLSTKVHVVANSSLGT